VPDLLPFGLEVVLDEVSFKLIVACVLCGLIGLEREYRQKAAGFRTHLLVGLGSTMFTLLSVHGFGASDPSRVAAQIVSGIGFIGGGAILRHGLTVRGLTTASTLWLVASIGMAVAVGWYEPGLIATAMALLTLILLSNLERVLPSFPRPIQVQLRLAIAPSDQSAVRTLMQENGWTLRRGQLERVNPDTVRMSYLIRRSAGTEGELDQLISALQALPGLKEISWEILETA
jgi:putative Mg2+ transporter-C (MgtC) family protein